MAIQIDGGITIDGGVSIGSSNVGFTVSPADYSGFNVGQTTYLTAFNTDAYQATDGPYNDIVNYVYGLNTPTGSINTVIQAAWIAAGYDINYAYAWNAQFNIYTPPYPGATGSAKFFGSGSLSIPNSSGFDQNDTAWTVECWVFTEDTTNSPQYIYGQQTNNMLCLNYAPSTGKFNVDQSGVGYAITSSGNFAPQTWHHVAMTWDGNTTVTLYVDGTAQGTANLAAGNLAASAAATLVGSYGGANYPWYGLITNLRVTQGVEVYTGNFAVPTNPLTVTQSAGTNISAITGGQTQVLLTMSTSGSFTTDSSTHGLTITASNTNWSGGTPFYDTPQFNYNCIVRASLNGGQFNLVVIDTSDSAWQSGATTGPALLGAFVLPVTLSEYSPATQISTAGDWC